MGVIDDHSDATFARPGCPAQNSAPICGGRQARIFGSRVTGAARRASDIDLAISAPDMSVAEWHDLCEALENAPIIYELDIVREEDVPR